LEESQISHIFVFGCKFHILKKGTRLSKFERKCDEGFLLGYATNSKAYRVYNKSYDIVEEVHDVEWVHKLRITILMMLEV